MVVIKGAQYPITSKRSPMQIKSHTRSSTLILICIHEKATESHHVRVSKWRGQPAIAVETCAHIPQLTHSNIYIPVIAIESLQCRCLAAQQKAPHARQQVARAASHRHQAHSPTHITSAQQTSRNPLIGRKKNKKSANVYELMSLISKSKK